MASSKLFTFDTITSGAPGVAEAGITAVSGTWTIDDSDRPTNEPSAPSTASGANKVLMQTDTSAGQRRIAHLTNNLDAYNFQQTFEQKIFSDGSTYQAGVLFRGAVGNGYALLFDAANNTITLYSTAGQWRRLAQKTTVAGADDYITTDVPFKVKISVTISTIKIYVNNVIFTQTIDTTHTGLYFGFFTNSTKAWWDNVIYLSNNSATTVRTADWMKGISILEFPETGIDETEYEYDSANFGNSLSNLQSTNANTVMLVVPCHMHTVTSNEIWWDNDDDNHYDINTNPDSNNGKLNEAISSIRGMSYTDVDGLSRNIRVILNVGRFNLTQDDGWRGDLAPSNANLWWDNYRSFITYYAEIAENAEVEYLVIGSELRSLEGENAEWQELITSVRAVFSGQIIYGINWSDNDADLETIINNATWLNNIDIVGINAYFELVGSYTVLDADVDASDTTITLPDGEIDKYTEKTLIQLEDDVSAEVNYIESILGNIITLHSPASNSYTVGQNARIVETSALTPNLSDIIRGWDSGRTGNNPYDFAHTIALTYGKPLIFNEIGYRSLVGSVMFPWSKTVPTQTKHDNIIAYEDDTGNKWGWLVDDVMRDDVDSQELAYAAAFAKWWDVDWFYGFVWVGWTANPNEGFSSDTESTFWDADASPQNKPAQTILTQFFAAPNVRDSELTPVTYTTPEQVGRYLGVTFSASTPVTAYEVKRLILMAEDWIDLITQTSWRPHTDTEFYEFNMRGVKIFREPVRSVTSVKVFNGNVFETRTEGRSSDYWVDLKQGFVYFGGDPFLRAAIPQTISSLSGFGQFKRPVEVQYTWGRYFKQTGSIPRDKSAGAVEYIAGIWVATQLATTNDFSVLWPSGTDKVTLDQKVKSWQEQIDKFSIRQDKLFLF